MTLPLREWTLGQRLYRLEQSDLLCVQMRGGGSLQEVIRTVAIYRELGEACPFFALVDMEEAGGLEEDARHYIDKHVQPAWIRGFIYFNTRLLHRSTVMGMLIVKELIQRERHPWRGKVHFVPSEAEGRALYARLRAEPDALALS